VARRTESGDEIVYTSLFLGLCDSGQHEYHNHRTQSFPSTTLDQKPTDPVQLLTSWTS